MRIHKLSVDGFGLFSGHFDIVFPEDDTVALIVGDNETGKSTLIAAIGAILFGFKTENEKISFAPLGSQIPGSGGLEVEAHGKRYRFTRDFSTNRAKVELLGQTGDMLFDGSAKPGGRTEEKDKYDDLMRDVFGLESRELFQNSVLIEQNSLEPEMGAVARRIVSGASSADYTSALENLKAACEELTIAVPWGTPKKRKPRRIEILENDIRQKKSQLLEATQAAAIIQDSRDRLCSLESRITSITDDIERQKAVEKEVVSFSAALEEKRRGEEQLTTSRNEMRAVEKLTEDLRNCTHAIESHYSEYVALPQQAETELAELIRLRQIERELETKLQQTEKGYSRDIKSLLGVRFSAALIIAGLLVAGFSAFYLHGALRILGVIAGAAIAALPPINLTLSLREHESERQGKLSAMREQLQNLRGQTDSIARRYGVTGQLTSEDLLGKLRELKALLREKDRAEEALKQHAGLDSLRAKCDSLGNDLFVASKKIDELKTQRPSLSDIERSGQIGKALEEAKTESVRLEQRHRELTKERDDLKWKLAAAEAKETISEETLAEDIAAKEAELSQLKLSRFAHLLSIRVLDQAISEFRASHLARIERNASDYLENIAGERRKICLDPELEPLSVEEGEHTFNLAQLSQGALDQLHFALRLAAIEEVCGAIRLPILLDDPFVSFDETRLGSTLRMLDALSESHQIVLFTHDRRYCNWHEPVRFLKR
ncbi:MAG: AAA family ATPase [Candidatus Lindowbacteria bacterium]|nr:AAA family ATPase [Candidatus Lindowbacteria bacterium]